MRKFTIFQNFCQVTGEMTEEDILSAIRSFKFQHEVEEIRRTLNEVGEDAANEKKKKLPAIAFSATYRGGRKSTNLVKYLGYIVVDIDHLSATELTRIRQLIESSKCTYLSFISPKGMGIKIVVRACRPNKTLPQTLDEIKSFHLAAYTQIARFYSQLCGVAIDTSGTDVGRLCFFSHDPDAYFNPESEFFIQEQPVTSDKKRKATSSKKEETIPENAYASLLLILNYYQHQKEENEYAAGNRNIFLFHLACTCNRYGIPQETTTAFIKSQYTDLPAEETDSLIISAYSHTEEFNTRKLNNTQKRMLQIEQYIHSHYETRYNEMLHAIEYRHQNAGQDSPKAFRILDDMMENTIWREINEKGFGCNVQTIQNLIYSDFSASYHPICEYMEHLPQWNGTDYIRILADSVETTHQDFWAECLKRYLVAMCAAATQDNIVNHTVLLLCSEVQNIGKTTFINNLLPPELRAYLSTGLVNPSNKDDLTRVAQSMLINLDEFGGMSGRELDSFKDLVTRKVISLRLPYAHRILNFPHSASFAGTCNHQEILYDTTGNRRFLCFQVKAIRFIDIDYAQLYAQIKYLLDMPDYKYWFTQEENTLIEKNNEDFLFHTPEEELLLTHISKPERFDKVMYLTISEIAEMIRERTGYQYTNSAKIQLGKVLSKHKFESKRGKNGRRYTVHMIDLEQVKNNRLYE